MTTIQCKKLVEWLSEKNVLFIEGLTDAEIIATEKKYTLKFPPDLKLLLQTQLPISNNFINWRLSLSDEQTEAELKRRLNWPLEGMLFDIEQNMFWENTWGEKPLLKEERLNVATKNFETYPKLIPVCSHRYIPAVPAEADNPVFSVYQMDIIYYGHNLADYLSREFKFPLDSSFETPVIPKNIPFWSWCVEENG